MSATSREAVYAALFALLNGLATGGSPLLKDCSRRLKDISDDSFPANLPAAYQVQDDQAFAKKSTSLPPVMEWKAHWFLYGYSVDPGIAPSTVLNALIDATVGPSGVLTPVGQDSQTLGGLVTDAAVSGDIKVFEGLLGDRCVAIIPIRILVPGF